MYVNSWITRLFQSSNRWLVGLIVGFIDSRINRWSLYDILKSIVWLPCVGVNPDSWLNPCHIWSYCPRFHCVLLYIIVLWHILYMYILGLAEDAFYFPMNNLLLAESIKEIVFYFWGAPRLGHNPNIQFPIASLVYHDMFLSIIYIVYIL